MFARFGLFNILNFLDILEYLCFFKKGIIESLVLAKSVMNSGSPSLPG